MKLFSFCARSWTENQNGNSTSSVRFGRSSGKRAPERARRQLLPPRRRRRWQTRPARGGGRESAPPVVVRVDSADAGRLLLSAPGRRRCSTSMLLLLTSLSSRSGSCQSVQSAAAAAAEPTARHALGGQYFLEPNPNIWPRRLAAQFTIRHRASSIGPDEPQTAPSRIESWRARVAAHFEATLAFPAAAATICSSLPTNTNHERALVIGNGLLVGSRTLNTLNVSCLASFKCEL